MAKATAAKKRCFIVGPIGKPDGEERIHSDWLLEGVILPVFSSHYPEFVVQRADKISKAGMINTQIIEALLDAELVIADITTLNPNCFYEIGIRHVMQKPIIHMHLQGQSIPFDIAPFRSIEFARVRPKDLEQAKIELKAFVDEVLDPEYVVENPVTVARGKIEFEKNATPSEKLIQDQVDEISLSVKEIEQKLISSYAENPVITGSRKVEFYLEKPTGREDRTKLYSFVANVVPEYFPRATTERGDGEKVEVTLLGARHHERALMRLQKLALESGIILRQLDEI